MNFASNHGDVYHNDFDDILNAVTQLNPSDPSRDHPSELTQAENFRLHISYDDDNDPSTAPQLTDNFNRVFDPNWARSDARFVEGLLGEMYISSKWDGRVYIVSNSIPYDADFDDDGDVDGRDFLIWQRTSIVQSAMAAPGDANHDGFVNDQDLAIWQDQFVLSGDYNGDGRVDAADYTVWRDHLGQSFTLSNESPHSATPGIVDQEDYDFWKLNYGASFDSSSGSSASAAVPEPTSLILMISAWCGWCRRRTRRARKNGDS